MKMRIAGCLVALLFVASIGWGEQTSQGSQIAGTPEWDRIKSLVGEWDGYILEGGKKMEEHVSIRMTGGGSAVMHWMDAGTPHEMVTMFHMDKTELLATHYCAGHNQPRFRSVPSKDPKSISFEFKDGTNIRPGDGFMRQLTIEFVDADHHNEIWGYDNKGKIESNTFYLTRSKQPAKK